MSMERAGAVALIWGALAYVALMAVHPSHGGGGAIIGSFSLSGVVHATALVTKPILVFGFFTFSRHLGLSRPLIVLAFCFYIMASIFTMMAGTMSGLVFPYIFEAAHAPGGDVEGIRAFAQYTTWLNRSFARVHFDLVSVAILLWSIGWPAKSVLDWVTRAVGAAVGLGVLGWQLSGTMTLEARQGALWITLAHAAFILLAAATMLASSNKK